MSNTTIYNMDVLEGLAKLPSDSVDCIVTSPPYYGLRNYGKETESIWDEAKECEHQWGTEIKNPKADYRTPEEKRGQNATVGNSVNSIEFATGKMGSFCSICGAWKGQLGLEPTYKLYLQHLNQITEQCKRVLKPTGTLWWNCGDTYNGNKEGKTDKKVSDHVKDTQIGLKKETQEGMKEKCLMMLPERFAINMIDQGWILRNKVIWYKPNHMPSSVKDRLSNSYEFIFFFTKSRKYYFNLDSIRQPTTSPAIRKWSAKQFGGQGQASSPISIHDQQNNPIGKNPGDIWSITTQPFAEAHFACFPPELPEYAIDAGCPDNGVVLDPFAGSGTTLQVAHEKRLEGIGIEINPKYINIIKKRLHANELLDKSEFKVVSS